jgi:signal transduction histidine kinase
MAAVIAIGFFVARLIINPLYSLVRTSRSIAEGDLSKRTEVRTNDEIGVLASTFDVMTDNLQQRTEELQTANQILEQMDRAKIRFIQVSAHELRTPLTLVQGYAQLVEMKSKDIPDFEKYAKGIVDGTSRMIDVVDNLLDASRIDSNLLDVKPTEVQLPLVVDKVFREFKQPLDERRLLHVVNGVDQLPIIKADGQLLHKAFHHIITNAIKYTPDGGSIMVSGFVIGEKGSPSREVEVRVEDTGIGVDPQNQKLVFEKFYQTGDVMLHSSGKTKFKGGGPGLGLAIARGIIEAHHGRIWLESPGYDEVKNPGTTIFVRLPVNMNGVKK